MIKHLKRLCIRLVFSTKDGSRTISSTEQLNSSRVSISGGISEVNGSKDLTRKESDELVNVEPCLC